MTGEAAATSADTGEAKAAKGDQEAAGGAGTEGDQDETEAAGGAGTARRPRTRPRPPAAPARPSQRGVYPEENRGREKQKRGSSSTTSAVVCVLIRVGGMSQKSPPWISWRGVWHWLGFGSAPFNSEGVFRLLLGPRKPYPRFLLCRAELCWRAASWYAPKVGGWGAGPGRASEQPGRGRGRPAGRAAGGGGRSGKLNLCGRFEGVRWGGQGSDQRSLLPKWLLREAGLEPDGVVDAADEELQADAVVAADAEVVPPAAPPPLPPPPCAPPPAHSNLLLPSTIPWAGVIDSQTGL